MVTPAKPDVLVLGAGVSGLTTGVCLAERGLHVRVRARELPPATTSAVAGASWGPYLVNASRVLPWSLTTLTELERIATLEPAAGVRLVDGLECSDEEIDPPDWARDVHGFRRCRSEDLPGRYRTGTGWRYRIPLVDMPRYLDYLQRRLYASGGVVEPGEVQSLAQATELAAVVVNCTGLGARALVPDPGVSPVRGQLVVVRNPGVDWFFQDQAEGEELTYFLPHGDHVVLGGSAIAGDRPVEPSRAIRDRIIQRCAEVEPLLGTADFLEDRVGFRPTRATVRLDRVGVVVHNYGHGASGLTLSWGCAEDVLTHVLGALGAGQPRAAGGSTADLNPTRMVVDGHPAH
jgi:D-amino-acid oxidase